MAVNHPSTSSLRRSELLGDRTMVGTVLCRSLARHTDEWLQDNFASVVADTDGIALVAVGGYGRAELCPHSDIDLLLLHRDRPDIEDIATKLWYPIWDEGWKLGHSVRTPREARELAKTDLDTATSLLDARLVAGDDELCGDLIDDTAVQWRRGAKRWLPHLAQGVAERHERSGEVAYLLEPDLKQGRGGLRDVHSLRWAEAAVLEMDEADSDKLWADYEVILAARAELHRTTDRAVDQLLLQEQDAVAAALDYADADELMKAIATAARSIAWRSDEIWAWLGDSEFPPEWRRRMRRRAEPNRPNRAVLAPEADASDPCCALRLARDAATAGLRMDRASLGRLQAQMEPLGDPWPDEARKLFVDLLLTGEAAPPVIEALDQMDLFVRILPEWAPNRNRPQRNAYHQFTVDRHLCEAAALAAGLVDRVDRPDLLVVGALLHDIGKGYPGDHTEVGMELVADIAHRMGYPPTDTDVLVAMVEHHLLLPDVATRRDLEDPDTIAEVSRKAGNVETLRLLGALTEADSIATGPSAWSNWKAGLVRELVVRCAYVMEGGDIDEITSQFPTQEDRGLMEMGKTLILGEDDTLVVIAPDRHGMFSRVSGALALSGLRVLLAAVHTEYGMALERYQVESMLGLDIDWLQVSSNVRQALSGRLAIEARLAERIKVYEAAPGQAPKPVVAPKISIDNGSSSTATIIELATQARIGLLSRVTSALSQLDLDILSAKVQDLGGDVVHAYYVRNGEGQKVTDASHQDEITLALQHAIGAG